MAMPEDGNKYELNQGELVVMPPPGRTHARIGARIHGTLFLFVNEHRLGEVYTEAGYVLSREPEITVRQPDVSFLSRDRLQAMPDGTHFGGAPDLAIEVISPSNTAEDLEIKIKQYLAAGSKEVWVFYPKTRSVHTHKAGGLSCALSDTDTISTDLFPGWSARVADFFNLDD